MMKSTLTDQESKKIFDFKGRSGKGLIFVKRQPRSEYEDARYIIFRSDISFLEDRILINLIGEKMVVEDLKFYSSNLGIPLRHYVNLDTSSIHEWTDGRISPRITLAFDNYRITCMYQCNILGARTIELQYPQNDGTEIASTTIIRSTQKVAYGFRKDFYWVRDEI